MTQKKFGKFGQNLVKFGFKFLSLRTLQQPYYTLNNKAAIGTADCVTCHNFVTICELCSRLITECIIRRLQGLQIVHQACWRLCYYLLCKLGTLLLQAAMGKRRLCSFIADFHNLRSLQPICAVLLNKSAKGSAN